MEAISVSVSDNFLRFCQGLGVSPKAVLEGFAEAMFMLPHPFVGMLKAKKPEDVFLELFEAAEFGALVTQRVKEVLGLENFSAMQPSVELNKGVVSLYLFPTTKAKTKLSTVFVEAKKGEITISYTRSLELGDEALKKLEEAVKGYDLQAHGISCKSQRLELDKEAGVLQLSVSCDKLEEAPTASAVEKIFDAICAEAQDT